MPRGNLLFVSVLPIIALALYYGASINGWAARTQGILGFESRTAALDQTCSSCSKSLKPPIIVAAIPHWSHVEKLIQLADGLVKKGYHVTFLGSPAMRQEIERSGSTFEAIDGTSSIPGKIFSDAAEETMKNLRHRGVEVSKLQRTLKKINDYRTIYIHDTSFLASAPLLLGTGGVRPHTTISIGISPIIMDSNDTMPFNSGLLPEKGPNAREKHWKAQLEQDRSHPVFSVMNTVFRDAMVKMGANPNGMRFASAMGRLSDIHCQLTVPEFELPRNDLRENLIYIGVPKTVGVPDRSMPEWWDKIVQARRQGKKVVAVTRSSADPSLEGTIVPGIEALKNRDDLIVVVSLVNAEIDQLKLAYPVPDNVYVAKFIPMDLFLPYVDVIVTNAGYGTFQHALRAGTPVVVSGITEDKPQIGTLVQFTGVGLYRPGLDAEAVSEMVDKILADASYRQNAERIKEKYKDYDPIDRLDEIIQDRTRQFEEGSIWNR